MAFPSAKPVVQAVYFLAILAFGLVPNMTIDIHVSTQLIAENVESVQRNSTLGLYLIRLLFLFLSLIVLAVVNPFSARSVRKLTLHSMIYTVFIAVLLTGSAYTQYQFNVSALSVSASTQTIMPEIIWQTSLLRTILFIAGSPLIIYLWHIIAAKRQMAQSSTRTTDSPATANTQT